MHPLNGGNGIPWDLFPLPVHRSQAIVCWTERNLLHPCSPAKQAEVTLRLHGAQSVMSRLFLQSWSYTQILPPLHQPKPGLNSPGKRREVGASPYHLHMSLRQGATTEPAHDEADVICCTHWVRQGLIREADPLWVI